MEYILELDSDRKLRIPDPVIHELGLTEGTHFKADMDGGIFIIELLPFSSRIQGELLDRTIDNLHEK